MKIPSWAIVVACSMIFFGGCSILKNTSSINSSAIIKAQEKMLKSIPNSKVSISTDSVVVNDSLGVDTINNETVISYDNLTNEFINQFTVSKKVEKYIKLFGYLGLLVALLYILGGVFILLKRKFAIKFALMSLIFSISFSIIKAIVLSNLEPNNILVMATSNLGAFGIIIDIVFIIIILLSYKEYNNIFNQNSELD